MLGVGWVKRGAEINTNLIDLDLHSSTWVHESNPSLAIEVGGHYTSPPYLGDSERQHHSKDSEKPHSQSTYSSLMNSVCPITDVNRICVPGSVFINIS